MCPAGMCTVAHVSPTGAGGPAGRGRSKQRPYEDDGRSKPRPYHDDGRSKPRPYHDDGRSKQRPYADGGRSKQRPYGDRDPGPQLWRNSHVHAK